MISKNKKYLNRKGKEIRIYATDGCGVYSVHGAEKSPHGWLVMSFRPEDLIEVKTPFDVIMKSMHDEGYQPSRRAMETILNALRKEGMLRDGE